MIAAARQINLMDAARLLPPRRLRCGASAPWLRRCCCWPVDWPGRGQTQIRLRAASDRLESQVPALRQSVDALEANRGTVIAALRRNVEARERLVRTWTGPPRARCRPGSPAPRARSGWRRWRTPPPDGAGSPGAHRRHRATGDQRPRRCTPGHLCTAGPLARRAAAAGARGACLDIQRAQQGSDLAFSIGAGDGSGTDKPGEPASGRSALRSATAGPPP